MSKPAFIMIIQQHFSGEIEVLHDDSQYRLTRVAVEAHGKYKRAKCYLLSLVDGKCYKFSNKDTTKSYDSRWKPFEKSKLPSEAHFIVGGL